MNSWDEKYINLCNYIAENWSKDRSTKVAAVIVNNRKKIVSLGYNGFPIGIDDSVEERHERPEKYLWTEHAERNAIYSAAELGVSVRGCTMYCNYLPCPDCARAIIQSGITEVIFFQSVVNSGNSAVEHTKEMFLEAGIIIRKFE